MNSNPTGLLSFSLLPIPVQAALFVDGVLISQMHGGSQVVGGQASLQHFFLHSLGTDPQARMYVCLCVCVLSFGLPSSNLPPFTSFHGETRPLYIVAVTIKWRAGRPSLVRLI